MGARVRSWWPKTRKPIEVIGFIAVLVVAIALIFVEVRLYGTGFTGKTLWDWLQLLIVPLVLAIVAILFNRSERKNEQRIASDNQQEAALQEYIKEMSGLLLHEKLRESQSGDEVRTIARVRTLTALPRLDDARKISALQFLYESKLIDKDNNIIDLAGADLSHADLGYANLKQANLSEANLSYTNLSHTLLSQANLTYANLEGANLKKNYLGHADLSNATLVNADLSGASFRGGAILESADFTGAILKDADLKYANLEGAVLEGADLSNAYFRHANLSYAHLI